MLVSKTVLASLDEISSMPFAPADVPIVTASPDTNDTAHAPVIPPAVPMPAPVTPAQSSRTRSKPPSRRRRYRPGTVARREIRKYQGGRGGADVRLLIPRRAFRRLVREVMQNACAGSNVTRFRANALEALQEGSEQFIVDVLARGIMLATKSGEHTLYPEDTRTVLQIMKMKHLIVGDLTTDQTRRPSRRVV